MKYINISICHQKLTLKANKNIYKIFIFRVIIFFLVLLISVFLYLHYSRLERLGIHSLFLKEFSINNISVSQSEDSKITFLYLSRKKRKTNELSKQKEKIAITIFHSFSPKQAVQKMKSKTALIESVFHPKPAPYFAIFTKEIICPKDFLPMFRKKEGLWRSWTMFANKRQGFGVCDKSEIAFINHKLLRYCPLKKNLLEIDYFTPVFVKDKLPDLKESLLKLEKLVFCNKS